MGRVAQTIRKARRSSRAEKRAGTTLAVFVTLLISFCNSPPMRVEAMPEASGARGTTIHGGVQIDDGPLTEPMQELDEEYRRAGDEAMNEGHFEDAIWEYTRALQLNPKNVMALQGRAEARLQLHDFKGAIQDCRRLIEIAPRNPYARYMRAMAYLSGDKREEAIRDLVDAIALFDAQGDYDRKWRAQMTLAAVYHQEGQERVYKKDYLGAEASFTRAIELNSQAVVIYCDRARVRYLLGETASALDDLNTAVRLGPLYADAFLVRGTLLFVLSEYDSALQDLNRAVLIDPDSPDGFYMRALCLEMVGNFSAATRDLERALALYNHSDDRTGAARAAAKLANLEDFAVNTAADA